MNILGEVIYSSNIIKRTLNMPHLLLVSAENMITMDMDNHLIVKVILRQGIDFMEISVTLKGSRETPLPHQSDQLLFQFGTISTTEA